MSGQQWSSSATPAPVTRARERLEAWRGNYDLYRRGNGTREERRDMRRRLAEEAGVAEEALALVGVTVSAYRTSAGQQLSGLLDVAFSYEHRQRLTNRDFRQQVLDFLDQGIGMLGAREEEAGVTSAPGAVPRAESPSAGTRPARSWADVRDETATGSTSPASSARLDNWLSRGEKIAAIAAGVVTVVGGVAAIYHWGL